MISVSLVILTWNRLESVRRSLTANLKSAGYPIREIIHVDNGSESGFADWFQAEFKPAIQVRHATNLGVSKGYNRGFLLATSSHIVITGCDRVMPDNWLLEMVQAAHVIPETAVISVYTDEHPTRCRAPITLNGLEVVPALPFEARFHSREFLLDVGFFREDFGLYGYEDCEWSDRAERVAREQGRVSYILPHIGDAIELPDDDFGSDMPGAAYDAFKVKENDQRDKMLLKEMCWALDNPYYNPYARVEVTPPLQPVSFYEWCNEMRAEAHAIGASLPDDLALYYRRFYARLFTPSDALMVRFRETYEC